MTRLFRNPSIKVGDKVRIHAEPLQPVRKFLGMPPHPEVVGMLAEVTAVFTYDHDTSLDYDADYRLVDGSYDLCDSQFLEIV